MRTTVMVDVLDGAAIRLAFSMSAYMHSRSESGIEGRAAERTAEDGIE